MAHKNIEFIINNPESAALSKTRLNEGRLVNSYQSVGILGGGTAGYLTALALQKSLPHLSINLIESSQIPVIGVGEATVTEITNFLHQFLEIDIHEFYKDVQPTWKQGIRFEWGQPGDYYFDAPFDWTGKNIGLHGAQKFEENIANFSLGAMLMRHGLTPIIKKGRGRYESYLPAIIPAYHLDNGRLIKFLKKTAIARGLKWIDTEVENIGYDEASQRIKSVTDKNGKHLKYDFYVDCSGFRSLLLEKTLKTPFIEYNKSLFNDRALTFQCSNGNRPRPYTTAKTMQSGWCWEIPMLDSDHCGYVHSSQFCSRDDAEREIRKVYPNVTAVQNLVHFRSGRHASAWRGNVLAIGNSFAFVEPLESTGILMIINQIQDFIKLFPENMGEEKQMSDLYNRATTTSWDLLRWFLSIHFKFNKKFNSPYWKAARSDTDISGIQQVVDLFQCGAPLSLRKIDKFLPENLIPFYGLSGLDCILMGQKVEARMLENFQTKAEWKKRKKFAEEFTKKSVPQFEAMEIIKKNPYMLDDFVNQVVHHI